MLARSRLGPRRGGLNHGSSQRGSRTVGFTCVCDGLGVHGSGCGVHGLGWAVRLEPPGPGAGPVGVALAGGGRSMAAVRVKGQGAATECM